MTALNHGVRDVMMTMESVLAVGNVRSTGDYKK